MYASSPGIRLPLGSLQPLSAAALAARAPLHLSRQRVRLHRWSASVRRPSSSAPPPILSNDAHAPVVMKAAASLRGGKARLLLRPECCAGQCV